MLLTELVQDPFEGLNEEEQEWESPAEAEGRQAVIEAVSEVHEHDQDDAGSGQAQAEDD